MDDKEDFYRARDEYNRGRRALKKGKNRRHQSRRDREEARKRNMEEAMAATKTFAADFVRDELVAETSMQDFLQREFSAPVNDGVSAWDFWKAVQEADSRFMVKNANVLYVKALAYVAAMFMWLKSCSEVTLQNHLNALTAKSGMRVIGSEMQLLMAIHKVAIFQLRDTEKNKRRARVTTARDTRAILWLLSQEVMPDRFVASQEENGGGIDEWYSNYRAANCPASAHEEVADGDRDAEDEDEDGDDAVDDAEFGESDDDASDVVNLKKQSRRADSTKSAGSNDERAVSESTTKDGLLKLSKAKAEECNCIKPSLCADRDIFNRFSLKRRDYLVAVYLADDSYAGASIVAAAKFCPPGTKKIRAWRMDKLIDPLFERGRPFKV